MGWNTSKKGAQIPAVPPPTVPQPPIIDAPSDVMMVKLPQVARTGALAIRGTIVQYMVLRERGEEINILSDGTNLYVFVGDVAITFGLMVTEPLVVAPPLAFQVSAPAVAPNAGVSVTEPKIPPPEGSVPQPVDFQNVLLRDVGIDMNSMVVGSELAPLLNGPPNATVHDHNPWTPSASIAIVGRDAPSGEFLARFGGYDGHGPRPANWQDPDEKPPEPPPI